MDVRRHWTLDDLFDAHDLLDMRAAAEAEAYRGLKGPA